MSNNDETTIREVQTATGSAGDVTQSSDVPKGGMAPMSFPRGDTPTTDNPSQSDGSAADTSSQASLT